MWPAHKFLGEEETVYESHIMEGLKIKGRDFHCVLKGCWDKYYVADRQADQMFNLGRSFWLQGREYSRWGPDREQGSRPLQSSRTRKVSGMIPCSGNED